MKLLAKIGKALTLAALLIGLVIFLYWFFTHNPFPQVDGFKKEQP